MKALLFACAVGTILLLTTNLIALATGCYVCDPTLGCLSGQSAGHFQCLNDPCRLKLSGCTYGTGCFLAGTTVTTPTGAIPIQNIQVGDLVSSIDANGHNLPARVTRVYRVLADEYLLINGNIGVTADHPFWAGGRWVKASDLATGAAISSMDGTATVIRVERVERGVRVYNIEVDGNHTFFASGMLVHNKPPDEEG